MRLTHLLVAIVAPCAAFTITTPPRHDGRVTPMKRFHYGTSSALLSSRTEAVTDPISAGTLHGHANSAMPLPTGDDDRMKAPPSALAIDLNQMFTVAKPALSTAMGALALIALGTEYGVHETIKADALQLWQSYTQVLASAPIATKAVTSGVVYTIGDIMAQRSKLGDEEWTLDVPRTIRSMLAGLCGHGILSHFWYDISETFFNDQLHWTAWWATIPKIGVDQLFWGPSWNAIYMLMLGMMKLEDPASVLADIKRNTLPLIVSGLKLWPLAHVVTYGLLPTEHRLLWVDIVEIVWVVILATQANSDGVATDDAGTGDSENVQSPVVER